MLHLQYGQLQAIGFTGYSQFLADFARGFIKEGINLTWKELLNEARRLKLFSF